MIDPAKVCLFIPAGLKKFKLDLFERIGRQIEKSGGVVARHDPAILAALPIDIIPIVGCQPESTALIAEWRKTNRPWIYWDRGYWLRVFATWLPRGQDGGLYRWHLNGFQMQQVRDVPSDRYDARRPPLKPWAKGGRHVVVAHPTATYTRFHGIEGWTDRTIEKLSLLTDRQIVVRSKETKRPLQADIEGAHALVAHGSNTAVESVICGCPVVVHRDSAAALVGHTELSRIENPLYPDREQWLRSLAYSQFDERELVDGTLWRLLS